MSGTRLAMHNGMKMPTICEALEKSLLPVDPMLCNCGATVTTAAGLQVPTTVMAMVDSSVGGKTGVNHPLGKNMIGAFYQPRLVQIDVETLNTLPKRELASGISEIVKYGLIRDPDLFVWLEQNMDKLLARDAAVMLCPGCISHKAGRVWALATSMDAFREGLDEKAVCSALLCQLSSGMPSA